MHEAAWTAQVGLSPGNQSEKAENLTDYGEFRRMKRLEMDQLFDWRNFRNETLRRLFSKAADIGFSVLNDTEKRTLRNKLISQMSNVYRLATVEDPSTKQKIPYSPNVSNLMSDVQVSEEAKRLLWTRWQDATGRRVRQAYQQYVELTRELSVEAGFDNYAQYWQSSYEPKPGQDFEKLMSDLLLAVMPLYKELHAYVRHALKKRYGEEIFPPTGHIPAHILGHMSGARWSDLISISQPFPDEPKIDITREMKEQVRRALYSSACIRFFASLGLGKMTDTFWEKSMMEKPPGRSEILCQASAWDFYTNRGDFRIRQCTSVDVHFLTVTHHEMGHVQYFMQYEHQNVVFRRGGNPGFHEAIGDTIALSVMTPSYLRMIGLLKAGNKSKEFYANLLYLVALKEIAILPQSYLVDHYRYKLFKDEVPQHRWNAEWVNLRCRLMGLSSPVLRSEEDFDPGSIYHVVADVEYMRYFVSTLLTFQFHKSLCNAAGVTENLHKCCIYNSSAAGAKLKALLSKGSSEHWEDTLFEISGVRHISAQPLLDYFEPLYTLIRAENARNNVTVGWEADCPQPNWYSSLASSTTSAGPVNGVSTAVCWIFHLWIGFIAIVLPAVWIDC
uniref:Angiotensin-converting enzyme n=1 Tax=Macrostomum lignano TaxID=282301 RepID=A0A1I8HD79_9PLAT